MSKTYFNISDKLRLYEFDGMLDQYGDAAAAYSLRKLRNGYTGDAIRVRRSSDDAERDIGFYDNELDTAALLDWVNTEYVGYESDFSVNNQGWSATGGTSDGNIDGIDGQDDCLRLTADTSTGNHRLGNSTKLNDRPNSFRIELDYYIPSTNVDANSIKILTSGNNSDFLDVLDTWTSVTLDTGTVPSGYLYITMYANGTNLFTGNGSDVIYVKNIRVIQTTSNGHVHTWYDQSANANHAVQGTDTAQPKIVDAGAVLKENGKTTIIFDGVDDFLKSSLPGIPEGTDHTLSAVTNNKGTIGCYFVNGKLYNSRYFNADNNGYYAALSINGTYNYISSLNSNYTTNQQVNVISVATNNATNYDVYLNNTSETGTQTTSVPAGTNETYIGQQNRSQSPKWWTGDIQEIVFWSVDQTNSLDNIEFNVNTYYNIY